MRKGRFTEEQLVKSLCEANKSPLADVAKRHGISHETIYGWRKQASCPGQHGRTMASFIEADDPTPDRPPSTEPCACGAAVRVSHVIYRLIHELPPDGSAGS